VALWRETVTPEDWSAAQLPEAKPDAVGRLIGRHAARREEVSALRFSSVEMPVARLKREFPARPGKGSNGESIFRAKRTA